MKAQNRGQLGLRLDSESEKARIHWQNVTGAPKSPGAIKRFPTQGRPVSQSQNLKAEEGQGLAEGTHRRRAATAGAAVSETTTCWACEVGAPGLRCSPQPARRWTRAALAPPDTGPSPRSACSRRPLLAPRLAAAAALAMTPKEAALAAHYLAERRRAGTAWPVSAPHQGKAWICKTCFASHRDSAPVWHTKGQVYSGVACQYPSAHTKVSGVACQCEGTSKGDKAGMGESGYGGLHWTCPHTV